MTNTIDNQPTAVALQLTDELLLWQSGQSPPTRKLPVSGLAPYYLLLSNPGSISGNLTIAALDVIGLLSAGTIQASGSLTVAGGASMNVLNVGTTITTGYLTTPLGSEGAVAIVPGDTIQPGYIAFFEPSGTRVGYAGFGAETPNHLILATENGFTGWNVTGDITVAGGGTIETGLTVVGGITADSLLASGGIIAEDFATPTGTIGAVGIIQGTTAYPGIAEFLEPNGTRAGYVGLGDGMGHLLLETENDYTGYTVTGNLQVNGNFTVIGTGAGVTSFNTRVGAVTLTTADWVAAQPTTLGALGMFTYASYHVSASPVAGNSYAGSTLYNIVTNSSYSYSGTWKCISPSSAFSNCGCTTIYGHGLFQRTA